MQRVTSGPVVNESLETNIDGVFACGNVLHVHDLVDFVSEEAGAAGRNAAKYVKEGKEKEVKRNIKVNPEDGVRYTVPCMINPENMDDVVTVRFRVGNIYKNHYISVYFGDERVQHKKRQILAPGEMEQVKIKKEDLEKYADIETITIKLEEE